MELILQLFLSFAKVGLFCIGGGYASLPLIQEEVVTRFAWMSMNEFVDIFQFGDSFYDCLLTVYAEVNDVDAIRSKLENYAEIEEVWTAVSKRQFRRWVARLDDENGYWEECVMTDDFLQNRLEAGAPKCRFCTDPEEVK